jgi:hypothetical protein
MTLAPRVVAINRGKQAVDHLGGNIHQQADAAENPNAFGIRPRWQNAEP